MAAERPPFERMALILQGGGALGSYHGGDYHLQTGARPRIEFHTALPHGGLTDEAD